MTRRLLLAGLLVLPLAGFALLLAVPDLDVRWEHDPAHFWIVLGVALVNVVLGAAMSEAARQRDDARLFFVSLALLASAGFFALHALATPGVVTSRPNAGFFVATPVGLLLASAFAAVSATDLEQSDGLRRWQRPLRVLLLALVVAWAAWALAELPPLDAAPPDEAPVWLDVLVPFGIAGYAFAALRYRRVFRERRRELPLAVAVAFVLLAEALVAVAYSRSWHVSWWEWHVLLALAFGAIVIAARREFRSVRSLTQAFGGLYLGATLERLDRRQSSALAELAAAASRGDDPSDAARHLRAEGFTGEELAVLERSARELSRVDELLRRYVGPQLADRLSRDPTLAQLGGVERDVTALFADLVSFTPFTEANPAASVVDMLNA